MTRKTAVSFLLVFFALAILGVMGVGAQIGDDDLLHNTSWTFQNLASEVSDVEVGFYNTQGSLITTDAFTVAGSTSFWAPTYTNLDNFEPLDGSLVAQATQPLASISNQVAVNQTTRKTGNATYRGSTMEQVAPTIYVPILMKNFGSKYWTEVSIQSTASTGSTAVNIHYFDEDGNEVSGSPIVTSIPAGSSLRVAQADEVILPDGFIGSMIVEAVDAVTPLAVVVNEFTGYPGRMYDEFYSYEGMVSGATRIVLPAVFVNGYGVDYQSSTSVQNLSGPDNVAEVTWHFYDTTPGNPNASTEILSFTEQITTSKSVYYPDVDYVQQLKDGYLPNGETDDAWVGALILESTEPIVAIVNELNLPYHAASYVGLSQGQTELFFPLAFVKAYGFANTSFSIADMSGDITTPVSVTVEYIADKSQCPDCSNTSDTYTFTNIDSRYQPTHLNEEFLKIALSPDGVFVGSVRIRANKPINGIMNETLGDFGMDNLTSFNAFLK